MTEIVVITDGKEEQCPSVTNNAFYELKSLRTEMEFQGSVLGITWSELSRIMGRYQEQLIQKHEQLDSLLNSTDRSRLVIIEDDLKKSRQENGHLQKLVCDIESKLLAKDSEIVNLRSEVHKLMNDVMMKENLIQKINGQKAEESSPRQMLKAGNVDHNVHSVKSKRRKITATRVQRTPTSMSSAKSPYVSRITSTAPTHALATSMDQSTPAKIETESFQISCKMAGSSSDQTQHNEMDSSFTATDQSHNELQDSSQEQNFIKMEIYGDTDAANMEGLMQEQDPNMFLENAPGHEQVEAGNVQQAESLPVIKNKNKMYSWIQEYDCLTMYLQTQTYLPGSSPALKKSVRRSVNLANSFEITTDNDGTVRLFHQKRKSGTVLRTQALRDKEEQMEVFQQFHGRETGGHSGVTKTTEAICQRFYWPGMTLDVRKWIESCEKCERNRPQLQAPVELQPVKDEVTGPWDMLGIDLMGPLKETQRGNNIFTTADYSI